MTHRSAGVRPTHLSADYVVVGSGAGGAIAAAELARAGARVALIEAGAWRQPQDLPHSILGTFGATLDQWGVSITRGRALWPIVQGRAVGGGTVVNSAIIVRTPADLFERWSSELGIDGLADAVWAAQDEIEAELEVGPTQPDQLGRHNALALAGAAAAGYPSHPTVRATPGCAGAGTCLQGCRRGHKRSADLVYVPQVLDAGGWVLSNAPVRRVLVQGGKAVGVAGRFIDPITGRPGGTFRVDADKAVILAASAAHTPTLLQRSGVRHPALGEGFRAHPGTTSFGIYPDPVDMVQGASQGWASTAFRTDPGYKLETLSMPPELVAGRLMGGGKALVDRLAAYRHMACFVVGIRAESVGTVRAGWGGAPVVRYTLDRADMERARHAIWTLARTHFAAGAEAVVPGVVGLPYSLGPDQVDRILQASLDPRHWVAILSHLFGGAVMGADPQRAVCDPRGRVRGVRGLLVVDAAVIPSNLGVNPQHTIMALSRTFTRRLLEEGA
ncbi:MAG: GMC family oxidoreductase [Deltaproteobacteria bacterium]|nr:GMC family oxidoreductase [Deltaproteobacteria bacterium]